MTVAEKAPPRARVLSKSPSAVRARHRRWKLRAAEILHWAADEAGHCSEYDKVVVRAGLPPRPHKPGYRDFRLVGESTEEEFRSWKRRAERILLFGARHGEVDWDDAMEALTKAGFEVSPMKDHSVPVEVTVRVNMRVTAPAHLGSEDLAALLQDEHVYRQARDEAGYRPEIRTWRVVTDG